MKRKKVVLAFSGGLDTSYCAAYLAKEKEMEVYSAVVDTGGFSDTEKSEIKERALRLDVKNHICIDISSEFYQNCIRYLIYGNVLRNNTYPLSVSSERFFQSIALIDYAKSINADAIAHGSTGAGNDQIRFDVALQVLAPEMEIIAPVREQKLSRQAEINYLKKAGIDENREKAAYSINKGIWGTSIGGKETLTSDKAIPDKAYPTQMTAKEPESIFLHFEKGEIKAVNDKTYQNPIDAIKAVEKAASPFAIGRDIHIGDTIIGIKGRVAFEAAAPLLIIKAHHALEKHTLTKWQLHWKKQLADWYGMFLHEAMFLEPVMRNIECFLTDTQKNVTGTVEMQLRPYHFTVVGIQSPNDLMNKEFADYGEENTAWNASDIEGFTKILSNQMKIYFAKNML